MDPDDILNYKKIVETAAKKIYRSCDKNNPLYSVEDFVSEAYIKLWKCRDKLAKHNKTEASIYFYSKYAIIDYIRYIERHSNTKNIELGDDL